MKNYFGFGIAPSMFPLECNIERKTITPAEIAAIEGLIPCLNPSHTATISAMREKFNLNIPIPEKAPIVALLPGDNLIVMGVSGLPRLEGRHEYTQEEVENASFSFSEWRVF